jgi:hypothetical protein
MKLRYKTDWTLVSVLISWLILLVVFSGLILYAAFRLNNYLGYAVTIIGFAKFIEAFFTIVQMISECRQPTIAEVIDAFLV